LGRRKGWSIKLDFMPMVTRILSLESEIFELTTDGFSQSEGAAWSDLVSAVDSKIYQFGEKGPKAFEYAELHGRAG
jgi:hypothetical protein